MIKKIIVRFKLFFNKLFHFGFSIALWDILDSQRKRIGILPKKISKKINENKHVSVVNWLTNRFYCQISNMGNGLARINPSPGPIPSQIWICWWDGINNMPPIVEACYNSVLKYSNGFNVTLITKSNFKDFVSIPDHILEKVNNGKITITHFSDILRMFLLSEYGGLWFDATVFATGNIELGNVSFFTIKRELNGDYVPRRRWTGNCIGGTKDNPLFLFVRGFLCEYWMQLNEMIDYFLIDYSIMVGYNSIPQIKKIIDNAPLNPQNFYIIQDNLGNEYTPELFDSFTKNTILHKLTWKEQYLTRTANNKLTVYGYILEKYGDNSILQE